MGSVRISGRMAALVLMRLVLAAKFREEIEAEYLLSPLVNRLIDVLSPAMPASSAVDWANPAVATPQAFKDALMVVRAQLDQQRHGAELETLMREALKPYDNFPLSRLGL